MSTAGQLRRGGQAAVLAGTFLSAALFGGLGAPVARAGPRRPQVALVAVKGPITPPLADFIHGALDRAAREHLDAVLLTVDTPGGLLASARRIVEDLLNAPLPVIAYVAPSGASAASAGTFIVEAANIAAMAPGTTIGAAHPVEIGGELKGAIATKMENFTASLAKSIARARGRNEQWIEKAVRKSAAIDEQQALNLRVIDLVAPDQAALLTLVSGRVVKVGTRPVRLALGGAAVVPYRMSVAERFLDALANPDLVYLLMAAGVLGLYFELAHPGVFLPGVVGATCLLLALASFEVLPVSLAGALLVILGLVLIGSEAFVTSYGVLGLGGVVAFSLGSLILIDRSESDLGVSWSLVWPMASAMAALVVSVAYVAFGVRRRPARTGREGLVGQLAEVHATIAPDRPGWVLVHGERWRARCGEFVEPGEQVRVIGVTGLELEVRPERA
ncbi:MAG: nodulation protein NfeD [Deltaproteobacteria bacterium]|nr:nodulation protein NfeD [Deltaproteobacteria bacterium]